MASTWNVYVRDAGGLLPSPDPHGAPPAHWGSTSKVDAIAATVAALRAAGGTVRAEPFDTPVGTIAVVADPHGAGFSLLPAQRRA